MEFNLTFSNDAAGNGTQDAHSPDLAESATSLYRWLTAEPELRGCAEVTTRSEQPGQGHMGGALDIVNVVLANGIALGSLITAVVTWRGSRPRPPQVRLERNGVVVTLEGASPETVEQILKLWNENTGPSPASTDGDGE